jgi:hypothetical protein
MGHPVRCRQHPGHGLDRPVDASRRGTGYPRRQLAQERQSDRLTQCLTPRTAAADGRVRSRPNSTRSRVLPDVQPTLEPPAAPAVVLQRPNGTFTEPSPQALVPRCRQLHLAELCPSTRAILARLRAIPGVPLGGGPVYARPAYRPRTNCRQLHAPPRPAPTPGLPSLRALTGVLSCAGRARRAFSAMPAGPSGSAFPLKTGSVLLLGTT